MKRTESQRFTALNAKSYAQELAFAPFAFQATVVMRDTGLLQALDAGGEFGLEVECLAERTGLSAYGVSVLLDFGVNLRIVRKHGERFVLDSVGYFILHDEMTRVNMDFTRDVCYQALPYLEQSIREGYPAGLQTLGDWDTIYEGLTRLPGSAAESWLRFDHFYSDRAFDALLPIVFDRPVRRMLDIGSNTGRWALKCLRHDPRVQITLLDLPRQLEVARGAITEAGFAGRADYHAEDLRGSDAPLRTDADVVFMSQFLDCFPEPEIGHILRRLAAGMAAHSRLYVLELFPDRQSFPAARFSLDATSLYFTCLANGTSRMYHSDRFVALLRGAGFEIESEQDGIGLGHTLLRCRAT